MYGQARKKPVSIDWFLFKEEVGCLTDLITWCQAFGDKFVDHFLVSKSELKLKVKTLEGTSYDVSDGYIIIRGVEGEYYPCDVDIFNKTYEIH